MLDLLAHRAGPWRSACQEKPRFILRLRPTMMLSSAERPWNRATFWKVRAMPLRRRLVGAHAGSPFALVGDVPFLRPVETVDAVEHRGLAGAVRPDDGAHLAFADVEGDVADRLHAAEGKETFSTAKSRIAAHMRRAQRARAHCLHAAVFQRRPPEPVCASLIATRPESSPLRPSSKRDLDRDFRLVRAVVERAHQRRVAFRDEAAAHLLGARQFAVIRVELLGQDEEARDLRLRRLRAFARQAPIHLGDMLPPRCPGPRDGRRAPYRSRRRRCCAPPTLPSTDKIDIEHAGDEIASVAEGHGLLDVRERISACSRCISERTARRELSRPTSLARSMILSWPVASRSRHLPSCT